MAINIVSVKCPDCGATLDIDKERPQMFCQFCGAKIIVSNDNEHIYRHIDDAEIKQAETEQMIQLKKLEIEERERIVAEKYNRIKFILAISFGAIGALLLTIGLVIHQEGIGIAGFALVIGAAWIGLFMASKKK